MNGGYQHNVPIQVVQPNCRNCGGSQSGANANANANANAGSGGRNPTGRPHYSRPSRPNFGGNTGSNAQANAAANAAATGNVITVPGAYPNTYPVGGVQRPHPTPNRPPHGRGEIVVPVIVVDGPPAAQHPQYHRQPRPNYGKPSRPIEIIVIEEQPARGQGDDVLRTHRKGHRTLTPV